MALATSDPARADGDVVDYAQLVANCSAETVMAALAAVAEAPEEAMRLLEHSHAAMMSTPSRPMTRSISSV